MTGPAQEKATAGDVAGGLAFVLVCIALAVAFLLGTGATW